MKEGIMPAISGIAICGQSACGQTLSKITMTSIRISKYPNKMIYRVGEEFDSAGLELVAVYSDGSTNQITDFSELAVTPNNPLGITDTIATVTYMNFTTQFRIAVIENDMAISGTAIYDSSPAPLQIVRRLNRAGTGTVDLFSGDLTFVHSDVSYLGERLPLEISHVYNSKIAQCDTIDVDNLQIKPAVGFGKGWALNVSKKLIRKKDKILLLNASGETQTFVLTIREGMQYEASAEIFIDEKGSGKTIALPNGTSVYKLYDDVGNVFKFASSSGRLYEICTNDGTTIKIKYDNSGKIIGIIDGAEREARLEYDANNLLKYIVEPTGRKTKYIYDNKNRLVAIAYLDANEKAMYKTNFSYVGETALISTVTDPMGRKVDYSYAGADGKRFVSSVADGTIVRSLSPDGVEYENDNNVDYTDIYHYRNEGADTDEYSYIVKTKTKAGIIHTYHFNSTGMCSLQYEGENDYEFFVPKNIAYYNYIDNYTLQTLKIPDSKHSKNLLKNGSFEDYSPTRGTYVYENMQKTIMDFAHWTLNYGCPDAVKDEMFADSKTGLALDGEIYQNINLNLLKSNTHYLLSGWALQAYKPTVASNGIDKNGEFVSGDTNELQVQISYKDRPTKEIHIPVDANMRGIQFIGKVVFIDDIEKIESVRVRVISLNKQRFNVKFDELRFEEIQEAVAVDNASCLIVNTGNSGYKKYDFSQITKLSVDKNAFVNTYYTILDDEIVTPKDFYVMQLNKGTIYCEAKQSVDCGTGDAKVTFSDGKSYFVKDMEIYNNGKVTISANGKKIVQENDVNKDTVLSTYTDINGKSFRESYTYNNHKQITAINYRNIVLQNTFGSTDITTALFPNGSSQKIVSAQGFTADKNQISYEADERHTDSKAIKYKYEYDAAGNITKCTFPDGSAICCDYDKFTGLPTRIYSGTGQQTVDNKYTYLNGMLVKIVVNDSDEYTFNYDGFGNITGVFHNAVSVYRSDIKLDYDYYDDQINDYNYQETTVAGELHKTYYDRYGKPIKTQRGVQVLCEHKYNAETGRVESTADYGVQLVTGNAEDVIKYEYSYNVNNGNVAAVNINGCGHNVFLRNTVEGERITKEEMFIDGEWSMCEYDYDSKDGAVYPDNTVSSIAYYKGLEEQCEFGVSYESDNYYRFKSREINNKTGRKICKEQRVYLDVSNTRTTGYVAAVANSANGFYDQTGYTYTQNGEIHTVSNNGTVIERYAYDNLGRLIREDNKAFNKTVVYNYDNSGNIARKTERTFTLSDVEPVGIEKTYVYAVGGIQGRLIGYNGKSLYEYTDKPYSQYGNPLVYFKHDAADYWEMGWSGSRLTGMRLFNSAGEQLSGKIDYLYSGNGIRTKKTVNGMSTDYIYVGGRLLREMHNGYRLDFLFGAEGAIGFEYTKNDSVAQRYYYLKNLQGDVTHIVDSRGNIVVEYKYNAWGKCRVYDADGKENVYADFIGNINPIRYRGYYYDAETELYYLQARYYDPEIGRFISPDNVRYIEPEILGGLSLYTYCYNNPIMYYDPSGRLAALAIAVIVCAVVGAVLGGLTAGLIAYSNGSRDWALVGNILLGVLFGAAIGALTGLTGGALAPAIGGGIAASGGAAAVTGASIGSWVLSGTAVLAGAAVTVGGATLIGNISFAQWERGSWPGDDPTVPPDDGFEWRGSGEVGSSQGNWYNPSTKEILHPDMNHPGGVKPHWDYRDIFRNWFRIFKNGGIEPKW